MGGSFCRELCQPKHAQHPSAGSSQPAILCAGMPHIAHPLRLLLGPSVLELYAEGVAAREDHARSVWSHSAPTSAFTYDGQVLPEVRRARAAAQVLVSSVELPTGTADKSGGVDAQCSLQVLSLHTVAKAVLYQISVYSYYNTLGK